MTDREAFEAWAGPRLNYSPKVEIGDQLEWVTDWDGKSHYYLQQTGWMWDTWQAARKAALEEAIQAVEGEYLVGTTGAPDDVAYDMAVRDCAAAIRAIPVAKE